MLKTIALGILVMVTLAFGGLLVQDRNQIAQQTTRIAELQTQVTGQREEIRKTSAAAAELEQKRTQLVAKAKAARQSLLEARAAAASTPPAPPAAATPDDDSPDAAGKKKKPANPFTDSITRMMKDPAMKDMMRATQSNALRQMYGDLVKQWSLSPDEIKTFYDLLLDKQMDQMDKGMAYLEKGPADAVPTPAVDPDAKLKASLGDDLYKQYQDYEKTLVGRLAVNQFQQQLANGNVTPLTQDQTKTMLQVITEEQANTPPGLGASSMGGVGRSFTMDAAQVDQFVKNQSDLNDRVNARMAGTLSTEQLQALKDQQQQMLSMQRMGMEMAAKMYGPSPTP